LTRLKFKKQPVLNYLDAVLFHQNNYKGRKTNLYKVEKIRKALLKIENNPEYSFKQIITAIFP
jgi:hypothetical protein